MKRALSVVAILAVAAACSSGGGSGSVPAKTATATATAAPQAIGSTKLSIKFPTGFVQAKAAASAKGAHTQYVNPTSSNYLDVYVNQQLVTGNGPTFDTVQISSSSDGTQTVTIPLYSGTSQDILVTERDTDATQYGGDLLAIGQTTTTITAAETNYPSVSMSMNATQFGYSTDGVSATFLGNGANINFSCGNTPTQNLFYLLPLDPQGAGEFAQVAGNGGIPQLNVYAYANGASPPPSNLIQNALGQYFASFDNNEDQVYVTLGLNGNNPAFNTNYYLPSADQAVVNLYGYNIPTLPNIYFYLVESEC